MGEFKKVQQKKARNNSAFVLRTIGPAFFPAEKWLVTASTGEKMTKREFIESAKVKIFRLVSALQDRGLTKEAEEVLDLFKALDEKELLTLADPLSHAALMEVLRNEAKPAAKTSSPSFAELLFACDQSGGIDGRFNERNFPLEAEETNRKNWEVRAFRFHRPTNGSRTFDILRASGFRYCGPMRAMQYIANHPDMQLLNPIAVTAFCRDEEGEQYVPVFYNDSGKRCVNCEPLDDGYSSEYLWLILCDTKFLSAAYAEYRMSYGELLPR